MEGIKDVTLLTLERMKQSEKNAVLSSRVLGSCNYSAKMTVTSEYLQK
jgi:hypothetical protein